MAEDLAFAAGIFKDCFGKGGDFTVVVEEPEDGDGARSGIKRVEFKVWASLLTGWSSVFDKMLNSEAFLESQQAQVVISDFSSGTVEIFLRFLYSGVARGPLETLVEVSSMADKYQVTRLLELCTEALREGLSPANACQLFAAAARFQLADLRRMALEKIWIRPAEALKECPSISPELLEEILRPCLICMPNSELQAILQGWSCKKRKAGEEATLPSPLQPTIERHMGRMEDELARFRSEYGPAWEWSQEDLGAVHEDDLFKALWNDCTKVAQTEGGHPPQFLGSFMNVIFGRTTPHFHADNPRPLEMYASNRKPFKLAAGSISWVLPYDSIYLTGLSFALDMPEQVHCRVYCSEDGLHWHMAADTAKCWIEAKKPLLRWSRPNDLVKMFKLEVLEGNFHNSLQVRGIWKDDLHY